MSDLSEILARKLIPWSRDNAGDRCIVARPRMSEREMPRNARLIPCPIVGKREVMKGQRYYGNSRGAIAYWHEAKLNEVNKFKLVCVLDGHTDFQLGGYKVQCGPGFLIFIPPGMPHPRGSYDVIDREKSTFCDLLYFALHPHALQCWIDHSQQGKSKEKKNYLILHEHAIMLFQILMEEMVAGERNRLEIGEMLLPGFFSVVLREANANRIQTILSEDSSAPGRTDDDDFASSLKRYVQANLHKPLLLENVAQHLYMSRAQFTRTVRRETGMSFNEFLISHRMEKAMELLHNSDWTITAISIFVGFKFPSYFNTVFKQHTGKTPVQYRALSHKTEKRKK